MKITTATLALALSATYACAEPAGLEMTELFMPHHGARTGASIWYPNGGGGAVTAIPGNAVFFGDEAAIGADVAKGAHPVVMFSHGYGGTIHAQRWLASALAERGAIVVSVNHPNTSWGSFDLSEGVRHWTRAQDISAALDALLEDPAFAGHIDTSRIMAAGFSYGGWTALSLGGAVLDHAAFLAFCEANLDTTNACPAFLSEEGNAQALDPDDWNASYADARITHVAAIEPAFVWGLDAGDVVALPDNVTLIGFGEGGDRLKDTDFDASGFAALLPGARIERFTPGFHFTAMPVCKPAGAAILAEDGDDPVCTDPEGTDRAAIHRAIVDLIAGKLAL